LGIPDTPAGIGFLLSVDRYGGVYLGGGINIVKTFVSPVTGSLTAGFIGDPFDNSLPDQGNISNFLSGFTVNLSGGVVGGGGWTGSPMAGRWIDHSAWEFGGFLPPLIGGSIDFTLKIR